MLINAGNIVREEERNIFAPERIQKENVFDQKDEWENNLFKEDYESREAIRSGRHKLNKKKQEPKRNVAPKFQDKNLFEDDYQKRDNIMEVWLKGTLTKSLRQAGRQELNKIGEKHAPIYSEARKGLQQYSETDRTAGKRSTASSKIGGLFSK